jgi:hypothetical protein
LLIRFLHQANVRKHTFNLCDKVWSTSAFICYANALHLLGAMRVLEGRKAIYIYIWRCYYIKYENLQIFFIHHTYYLNMRDLTIRCIKKTFVHTWYQNNKSGILMTLFANPIHKFLKAHILALNYPLTQFVISNDGNDVRIFENELKTSSICYFG